MTDHYRIIGAELSPFSVKVRSYFRFKTIPHQWIARSLAVQKEYAAYFKIPVIPLVVTPGDQAMQDSTPIIETLEARFPENTIHPADPSLKFISCLLEEFGDEWANKWMFHYRWAREVDQISSAGRIAGMMVPEADEPDRLQMARQIQERMVDRVWFVGSNAETAPQIEAGFDQALAQLDAHLANRPYLFGARPSFGDFGLYCQIYNAWTDPTPAALIGGRYNKVLAWAQRMLWPAIDGEFETWKSLEPTLAPFIKGQVGARFLPWSLANMTALHEGKEEFSVTLAGQRWTQKPQKYHVKSLAALRKKYAELEDKQEVEGLLRELDCLDALLR